MKIKGINPSLKAHQEDAVNKALKSDNGLILAHSVGSGKTLTSMAIANAIGKPVDVVVPASLIDNYKTQIENHTNKDSVQIRIYSLQDVTIHPEKLIRGDSIWSNKPEDEIVPIKDRVLVVDEAHRIRNEKSKAYNTIKESPYSKKILLTGTPIYNNPADMTNLLEILNKDEDVHRHLYPGKVKTEFVDFDKKINGIVESKFNKYKKAYMKQEVKDIWKKAKENSNLYAPTIQGLLDIAENKLKNIQSKLTDQDIKDIENTNDKKQKIQVISRILAKDRMSNLYKERYMHSRDFHEDIMRDLSSKYLHYYNMEDDVNKPKTLANKTFKTEYIEMTPEQQKVYMAYFRNLSQSIQEQILGNKMENLPPSTVQNPFFVYTREIANNYLGKSPKIDKMVSDIKKTKGKVLSYSNFLEDGVKPLANRLESEGIPYAVYTGEMSRKEKDQIIQDYNNDKIKTLIVSSAGGEGLNLKNTKMVQIMEPHWNEEKINQVIGRAVRMDSHLDVPEKDRNVEVKKYISIFPQNSINTTDSYMSNLSRWKQETAQPVKDIMVNYGKNASLIKSAFLNGILSQLYKGY